MRPRRQSALFIFLLGSAFACFGAASGAEAQPSGASALQVETGVDPDTVTVGQPFRSAVRLRLPEGFTVDFQEFPTDDAVEAASPVRLIEEGESVSALYELVAWHAGGVPVAEVPIQLTGPGGEVILRSLPLAMPMVASVLPASEGEVVSPRPVKGLLIPSGTRSFPWRWLLLVGGAALAALAYAWWRSRRPTVMARPGDPRVRALAELDTLLAATGEGADPVEMYRKGSSILRGYLARVDERLGRELTTDEVRSRTGTVGMDAHTERALILLLEGADLAKFAAGHPTTVEAARTFLGDAQVIVRRYPAAGPGSAAADRRDAA